MRTEEINIVFDGPPGPTAGRFVEVENAKGESICAGEWMRRDDGYWVLQIVLPRHPHSSATGDSDECVVCGHNLRHPTHGAMMENGK